MEMKPAHFTLIRLHRVVPSKCLQQPGNKGRDLRNIQKLKGYGSYGLSACLLFKKKNNPKTKNLIFTILSATQNGVEEKYSGGQ